ncbi:hypothetical protein ABMB44_13325 [Levilactobacillus brevis]
MFSLVYALAGTRQISYGGLFKQIKQDLKLEDVENGDLIHVGDEDYTKRANGSCGRSRCKVGL